MESTAKRSGRLPSAPGALQILRTRTIISTRTPQDHVYPYLPQDHDPKR